MNDLRFEAVYFEGEPDERSPEWNVIEWERIDYYEDGSVKAKHGKKVWTSYDMISGEIDAIAKAYELNAKYYSEEMMEKRRFHLGCADGSGC